MSDAIDNPNWHETTADAVDTQWLDAIGIAWKRITGRPWDTLDGETREEGLDANVGALFDELTDWKARAEKAENECAMQQKTLNVALSDLQSCQGENERFRDELERVKAELGIARDDLRDEQCAARADRDLKQEAEAELERVNKAFNPLLLLLGKTMDHVPGELRSRIVSAVAEAKAKGLL